MTEREAIDRFTDVQNKLFRYAKGIMKTDMDAEDVVQDTFIRLLKTIRNKKELDNLEAWCMTVARNRAFDLLKNKEKKNTVSDQIGEYQNAMSEDTTTKTLQQERWEIVELCLKELPPKYRDIIHLRDVEGYKYQEIANMTDMSLPQVKVTIHRARQHLKEKVLKKVAIK